MDQKITLNLVNIVGKRYLHIFKMDDKSIKTVETTREDYLQLGKVDPKNPTIEKGVWLKSIEVPKFDTKNGDLSEGDYADDVDRFIGKKDGYILFIEKNEVENHQISKVSFDKAVLAVGSKLI